MKTNKLIAEFMGLQTTIFISGILNYSFKKSWFELEELSFDKSWDWLIPVVKKIHEVWQEQELIEQCEGKPMEDSFNAICDTLLDLDIEVMYTSVVNFIQHYNVFKNR